MAQLEIKFDERFFDELGKAADVERLAPKLIDAALPIVRNALQGAFQFFFGYCILKNQLCPYHGWANAVDADLSWRKLQSKAFGVGY